MVVGWVVLVIVGSLATGLQARDRQQHIVRTKSENVYLRKFIYLVMRLLASSWETLIGSVTFTTHMSDHWSVGCYVVSKFPKRAENFTSMFLSEHLF